MTLAVPTQVRIYNKTLALVGSVNRVTNVDDGQPVTENLNEHWPDSVRSLLAEHPWNSCIKRAVLNKGAAPVFGEGYTYQLPADCLRWLPWSPDSEYWVSAVEEGGKLIADGGDSIRIRYIFRNEDVSSWAPHMVTAMGYRLAMDAAEAITQEAGILDRMTEKYHGSDGMGGALAKAKGIDGLATGDRDRGDVVCRSRALGKAFSATFPRYVPGG